MGLFVPKRGLLVKLAEMTLEVGDELNIALGDPELPVRVYITDDTGSLGIDFGGRHIHIEGNTLYVNSFDNPDGNLIG
jgi:hypothetical protein